MTGASKILTVSYGTFSCTLEGFNDPFNTMKAIAEYFRDLAADDRYFGAEPPQPDAAMLHKIAEREIQRRVDAKIQDNGVILRAQEVGMLPQAEPIRPSVTPAPAAMEPLQLTPETAVTTEAKNPAANVPPAAHVTESVAERLQRLRKEAQAAQAEMAAAEAALLASQASAQDLTIEDQFEDAFEQEAEPEQTIEDVALEEGLNPVSEYVETPSYEMGDFDDEDADDDALLLSLGSMIEPEDQSVPETTPMHDRAEADFTAELDRLLQDSVAAAVADTEEATPAQKPKLPMLDDHFDDDFEEDFLDTPATVAVDFLKMHAAEAKAAPFAVETPVAETPVVEAPVAEVRIEEPFVAEPVVAAAVSAPASAPVAAPRRMRPVRVIRPAAQVQEPAPVAAPEVLAPIVAEPDTAEPVSPARARVIRVRRLQAARPEAAVAPQLSAQQEADLAAELAALELDVRSAIAAQPAQPARPAAAPSKPEASFAPLAASAEESVDRLMDEASSQMDGSDTRRRQSAIAHLKAAVAATIAERRVTGAGLAPSTAEKLGAFREDLARVVRPASQDVAHTAKPSEKATPLVLVSEQRIDQPQVATAPVAPARIRPRRPDAVVAAPATAPAPIEQDLVKAYGAAESFADFADRIGAQEMRDVLEAAAAYIALVEGREAFTRPQLMQHVISATEDYSREDSLRNFGILLREGVIERSRRGLFSLSPQSAVLADAKRLAG